VPHPCVVCKGGQRCGVRYLILLWRSDQPTCAGISDSRPSQKKREGRGTHCIGSDGEIKSLGHPPVSVPKYRQKLDLGRALFREAQSVLPKRSRSSNNSHGRQLQERQSLLQGFLVNHGNAPLRYLRVPHPCVVARVGSVAACAIWFCCGDVINPLAPAFPTPALRKKNAKDGAPTVLVVTARSKA